MSRLWSLGALRVDDETTPLTAQTKVTCVEVATVPADLQGALAAVRCRVALGEAFLVLVDQADIQRRRLVDAGLWPSTGWLRCQRGVTALPYLLLIALGVAKVGIGLERDRPVILLLIMLLFRFVVAILAQMFALRPTSKGLRNLDRARVDAFRMEPGGDDFNDLLLALFGTAAVAGMGRVAYHQIAIPGCRVLRSLAPVGRAAVGTVIRTVAAAFLIPAAAVAAAHVVDAAAGGTEVRKNPVELWPPSGSQRKRVAA